MHDSENVKKMFLLAMCHINNFALSYLVSCINLLCISHNASWLEAIVKVRDSVSLVYSIFILEKLFQYNSTGLPRGPDF